MKKDDDDGAAVGGRDGGGGGGGGCPVRHSPGGGGGGGADDNDVSSFWKTFSWSVGEGPPGQQQGQPKRRSTCPVAGGGGGVVVDDDDGGGCGGAGAMPPSLEEAAKYAQTPQPGQRVRLGTSRQESSIPRGETGNDAGAGYDAASTPAIGAAASAASASSSLPHHQHDRDGSYWVYPSEQQLYNAMKRKGWDNVPEDSIPTVLQIHNAINERTWKQIQMWEGRGDVLDAAAESVRLSKFQGRPRDISPKAYVMCHLLRLRDPPFDRHDWYVYNPEENANGKGDDDDEKKRNLRRYVIDYYMSNDGHNGREVNPGMPPVPYIDARPALDSPTAVFMRAERFVQDAFPGITKFVRKKLYANNNGNNKEK